jgi:tRNA G18 (ribose-2'-O)-methylase SpoU
MTRSITRRAQSKTVRGYCGIGIQNAKTPANLGTLWRSAFCLDADFIFTVGARYRSQTSDTVKAYRHIPYWRFEDWKDFHDHIPYDCQLIGVEINKKAHDLKAFNHPQRAVYILGPEDGSLSPSIVKKCQHLIQFTSRFCTNVAVAGSIVLYDRLAKRDQTWN